MSDRFTAIDKEYLGEMFLRRQVILKKDDYIAH